MKIVKSWRIQLVGKLLAVEFKKAFFQCAKNEKRSACVGSLAVRQLLDRSSASYR